MGGIVPTLASLGHSRHLPNVICQTLEQANLSVEDLDAIAVTRGPGLPPCLPVGLNAAKTLAAVTKKPLIGVHHMEAHALTARLTTTSTSASEPAPAFPFMTLLISGGHTLLLTANGLGDYNQLGTTLDNAVGEAIDKTARILGLDWIKGRRGGPGAALEQAALRGDPERFTSRLPRPMLQRNKSVIGFSFSGLKTAMSRLTESEGVDIKRPQDGKHNIKRTKVNEAIIRLEAVAASYNLPLVCPPPQFCTDNGVMIAWAGLERLKAGLVDDYTITSLPKWSIESLKERNMS
ncbi:hypothetical protein DFQ28_008594 [Apophysomyces sp. BC1034]|nr:hypothetical protein DFQ28_008594 [Apophysomyces sp. BC1034]